MRVVGGRLRGRPLAGPKSKSIRPTADRLRESLFNILRHGYGDPVSSARVLDLFAGTGALGIEAASHGAAFVLFVDDGAEAARAHSRKRRRARAWRRHPPVPPRCHQTRLSASARAVRTRLPRSALRSKSRRKNARLGARRRLVRAGGFDCRRRSDQGTLCRACGLYRTRTACLRRHRAHLPQAQFGVMPASWTTLAQRATSSAWNLAR